MIPEQPNGDHLNDPRFQSLLVECLEKLERGETLDVTYLLEAHPEHAESMAAFLADQAMLRRVASGVRDSWSGQSPMQPGAPVEETIDSNPKPTGFVAGERIQYIGEYEILEEIARGGMGIVFKAKQQKLNRIIALKMILSGQLADAGDIERFQREARAAGQLKHPNIVSIHDVGEHHGHHYFTMDFIDGHSLANEIRDEALSPRRAAEVVKNVAEAVEFAHVQGILHRDLKPANILIDSERQPHITDFGLAKVVGDDEARAELTASGQILGTPSYMSPEQATGKHSHVGPATDVYSLGAVLYACLAGRAPFVADSPVDTLLQVANQDPVSPRQLNPSIPKDLETICLKCLHKEPHRRYGTAHLLAADLDRFLQGRPVLARPISRQARVWRWCKRNREIASIALLLVLTLLTLAIGGPIAAVYQAQLKQSESEAKRLATVQQEKAERLAGRLSEALTKQSRLSEELSDSLDQQTALTREAERRLHYSRISRAEVELEASRFQAANDVLTAIPAKQRYWETNYLLRRALGTPLIFRGHTQSVWSVAFSPDGRRVASGGYDKTARIWDTRTGEELLALQGHSGPVLSVAFSPDGQRVASGSGDKTVRVWDAHTAKNSLTLRGHDGFVSTVCFSPDGRHIASAGDDDTIVIWDATTGKVIRSMGGHTDHVGSVAFSPDGRRLASASSDASVRIWDTSNGESLLAITGHRRAVWHVAFSPDGQHVASAGFDRSIKVWDARTGESTLTIRGHTDQVMNVVFTPDGRHIVSSSLDRTARVWDANTGEQTRSLGGHTAAIRGLAIGPDGRMVASGGGDSTVRLWSTTGSNKLSLDGHTGLVSSVSFTPDGRLVVSGGGDGTVRVWDGRTGQNTMVLGGKQQLIYSVASNQRSNWLVSGNHDKTVAVWDLTMGKRIWSLAAHDAPVTSVAWSPDDNRIVSGSDDSTIRMWDSTTGKNVMTFEGHSKSVTALSFERADRLVSGSLDNTVKVWDTTTGDNLLSMRGHAKGVWSVAFSPDGRRIASGSDDKTIRIWDAETGEHHLTLRGHNGSVQSVAYSPDGRRLASGSFDKTVKIWDVESGETVLTLRGHDAVVSHVSFSPDGRRLLSGSWDKTIKIWDARSGETVEREFWSEFSVRHETMRQGYHLQAADESEAKEDWFAARFHLRRLVDDADDSKTWRDRLLRVEKALSESSR